MKTKMVFRKVCSIMLILQALTVFACAQSPYSDRGNWSHMMGYGYGGGFMWLILVVLVGIGIYFLVQNSRLKGSDGSIAETPLDILKKRYANGGIDKEEFERKRKDLGS